jgi:hypothetical protein
MKDVGYIYNYMISVGETESGLGDRFWGRNSKNNIIYPLISNNK